MSFSAIFVILSFFVAFYMLAGEFGLFRIKNRFMREKFVTVGAFATAFYCVACIVGMFLVSRICGAALLFAGISPFLIGRCASYKNLRYFTIIQAILVVSTAFFVMNFYP
ncbi:MAG: hypothetical protein ACI4CY_01805 [Candidatus Gastranaerophilaceae bacterium]